MRASDSSLLGRLDVLAVECARHPTAVDPLEVEELLRRRVADLRRAFDEIAPRSSGPHRIDHGGEHHR